MYDVSAVAIRNSNTNEMFVIRFYLGLADSLSGWQFIMSSRRSEPRIRKFV